MSRHVEQKRHVGFVMVAVVAAATPGCGRGATGCYSSVSPAPGPTGSPIAIQTIRSTDQQRKNVTV